MNDCSFDIPLQVKEEGLYRRPLPKGLIAFSSVEGRAVFQQALLQGNMANYFPLIEQFTTQAEPAFCGISSLVMVLNALEIDPGRVWKGPWRWFDENLTDCCDQIPQIKKVGVSFHQLTRLARCNGLKVDAYFHSETELGLFRQQLADVARTSSGKHMIVSYSRSGLEQTGGGHFSPIGAYHAERDLVLILDVARFKYPPYWVSVTSLWQAMAEKDSLTDRSRGYFLCEKLV